MSNMKPEDDDLAPLLESFMTENERQSAIDRTINLIKFKFKTVDLKKLGPIGWGKKPENRGVIVHFGPKGGEDRIVKKDGSDLLQSFKDRFKKALGPSSEEILAQENQEVREEQQRLKEAEEQLEKDEKIALEKQKAVENVQNLRTRLEQVQARIDALQEEHGSRLKNQNKIADLNQLEKNLQRDIKNEEKEIAALGKIQKQKSKKQADVDKLKASYDAKVKERNETEAGLNRTKPLDELDEQEETLKRRIEEAQRVIDDENASLEQKQAAAASIEADTGQLERLRSQMQQREEALPLRERVKRIFKKYGWTLQAVVLATGLVLGAVALAAMNGLKAGTKAVGNGLKTVGQSKVGIPPTWPHRLDCQLHLQIGWTGSLLPRRARLDAHTCCSSLLYGKAS